MKMKTKPFDCVDRMHRGATGIYEATKDLSRTAELEYWRQKAARLLSGHTEGADDAPAARKGHKATRAPR